MAIVKSTKYIIFYQISTGKVLSYQSYNFEYDDVAETYINVPEKQRCADNNGINISDIGIKKWNKDLSGLTPAEAQAEFKDNIEDLSESDLEVI